MTEERIYGTGAKQSPPDERDYDIGDLYVAAGVEPIPVAAIPDPYHIPGSINPVLDQNGYPECTAYSSSGMKAYQDRIDEGKSHDFDEHLFFKRIGGGPDGAFTHDAMEQMLKVGYPLVNVDQASAHRIVAYYRVPTTKLDIQQAILAFGPIILSTSWYRSWFKPVNGVLPRPDVSVGGHAIIADGWNANGLELVNSWGASWGVNGRCWMPWAYAVNAWEAFKTVDRPTPKPPAVTFKYGGGPYYRGLWETRLAGCRFRATPFLNGKILATVPKGTEFRNAQTTDKGALVNGSRRWLGDATGNKWIHSSLVVHAR